MWARFFFYEKQKATSRPISRLLPKQQVCIESPRKRKAFGLTEWKE